MKEILNKILKEYRPISWAMEHDNSAIFLNTIGGISIGITFIIIGLLCLVLAGRTTNKIAFRKRKLLTQMFGLFITSCGVARLVDVYCIWHHLAIINGCMKIFTGIISLLTLTYIPTVYKAIIQADKISDVKESLKLTDKKIDKLQEIHGKLSNIS